MCPSELGTSLGSTLRRQTGIWRNIATSWPLQPEHPEDEQKRDNSPPVVSLMGIVWLDVEAYPHGALLCVFIWLTTTPFHVFSKWPFFLSGPEWEQESLSLPIPLPVMPFPFDCHSELPRRCSQHSRAISPPVPPLGFYLSGFPIAFMHAHM